MKLGLAIAALAASALAVEIDPIVIKGSKFFYSSNNTRLAILIPAEDYTGNSSSSYTDPLADATLCKRDIPILQEINTNVIRVYAVDPTKNHTECMNMLAEAGIYVISDLSDPTQSIDRDDPTWETSLYTRYTNVVDDLIQYNNTLGFFAGNEVSNTISTTDASAFVKAAVRDTKAYIKNQGYRSIGVGYATNDDSDIRVNMADYFNCEAEDEGIDFWGYNIYSWCGDSSYTESGYSERTDEFRNYSVPVFFSEYGCNSVTPRKFTEIKALYGDQMNSVWSGGIVYMYFQTDNDYGLISAIDSTRISKLTDFYYYSSEIKNATPTGTNKASYTPTNTALQSCPAVASPLPPTPNTALCDCMDASAGCIVKDNLSSTSYADLFSIVCGYTSCEGIFHNGTTGDYGAYSMCTAKQQLNFVLDKYWKEQGKTGSACGFGGEATTTKTVVATGTCRVLMEEAGTVTSKPTGTGGSGDVSASASASLGAYVVTAVVAGLGMVLL
ncbi:putative 1,3-beta-glucanosyltransferase [Aspergillus sclerotiicarbonarius CBS 121057]|uniref:1,3-beta-glucanosyltransferase n=1 Tax=Aspergillus sclerotiicarbonarius (strain CBS 121057 / IBT 28362) TaxID=1448318 RepID=A0A319EIK9_ASPSB|nr:putative 1,3-beta-glucanosyltransferase [Aspergillus sclerotiicarbonarius CBS 121057]